MLREIVALARAGSKRIKSASAFAAASATAWRKDPAPLSAVLVTTNSAARVGFVSKTNIEAAMLAVGSERKIGEFKSNFMNIVKRSGLERHAETEKAAKKNWPRV